MVKKPMAVKKRGNLTDEADCLHCCCKQTDLCIVVVVFAMNAWVRVGAMGERNVCGKASVQWSGAS